MAVQITDSHDKSADIQVQILKFLAVVTFIVISICFSVQSIQASNRSIDRSRYYIVNTCEDMDWAGDICAKYNTQKYRNKYLQK